MPKTKERAPVRSAGPGRGPRRRWTNLRPLLVLVLLVVLAGAGWGIVYHSPLLDARKVAIGGLTVLQRDQIAAVAAVPVGEPLAGIDLDAIRARVAAVPRVASVRVEREWPHTVRISVRERTTALVVPDAGRYAEIDKDGVRFGTVDAAPSGVPVVKADANTVSRETLRGWSRWYRHCRHRSPNVSATSPHERATTSCSRSTRARACRGAGPTRPTARP